jgi:hypothetical protein
LLLSHVSIQICSFVAPCRRPILIATPLHQSLTWCTSLMLTRMGSRRTATGEVWKLSEVELTWELQWRTL